MDKKDFGQTVFQNCMLEHMYYMYTQIILATGVRKRTQQYRQYSF